MWRKSCCTTSDLRIRQGRSRDAPALVGLLSAGGSGYGDRLGILYELIRQSLCIRLQSHITQRLAFNYIGTHKVNKFTLQAS